MLKIDMKLICKTNKKNRTTTFDNITPGKSYDGTTWERSQYLIRDDKGEVAFYPKKCFLTIEESRDENIQNLLK